MEPSNDMEISLVNMFYRIFRRWRVLIVCMLIGAALLNVFAYYKTKKAAADTKQLISEYNDKMSSGNYDSKGNMVVKLPEFEKDLSERQISEVTNLLATYKMYQTPYADTVEYVNNSLLMQVDSKAVPTYTIQYLIDTHYTVEYPEIEKKDYTEDIQNSVGNLVLERAFLNKIAEAISTEDFEVNPSYAAELFTVTYEADTLSIRIYGRDEAECRKIMELTQEEVADTFKTLQTTYGEFDYTLLSEQYTESYSESILTLQKAKADMLNNIYNTTHGMIASLTDEQKAYFYALLNNEETVSVELPIEDDGGEDEIVDPNTLPIPIPRKVNPKYIVLGAFVGLIIGCGWIVLMAMLCGKLLTGDDIEAQYGLSQLGVWRASHPRKKIFGFIDRWLIRLLDSKGAQFSPEESLEMIAAGIRISARKNSWKTIYLTSTANDELTQESLSKLAEKLTGMITKSSDSFTNVSYGKSIVYDPESLENFSNADAAVLIEKVDTSKMSEIHSEYALCQKYDVPVIGYVTLK